MKNTVLGLDLGTNSIGWALIDKSAQKILGMGSRVIPMGSDKLDYEKGIGITKSAERRAARAIRKMGKRYKIRRNKLLFILHELEMCPIQFQFRHRVRDEKGRVTNLYDEGFPDAKNLQDLELLPIKRGTLQLDSFQHYELRVNALTGPVDLKDFGKILYKFNQLRGYSGGSDSDFGNKKNDNEDDSVKKKYETFIKRVIIKEVKKSNTTFKTKSGKGEELPYYYVTVMFDDEEKEGFTMLQHLEPGKEEELEIRIKQTKKGENIAFALPQKSDWRKQLEATEEKLKKGLFVGELLFQDLKENKWTKIRNRVILRNRYKQEFEAIWETQAKVQKENGNDVLNNCPIGTLEKIANYLYPGKSQEKLRNEAIADGLKNIIEKQVIYYQRPLKPQTAYVNKCQFEKEEMVLPISHPLFQEFRCWDQINRMEVTTMTQTFDEKKKKPVYEFKKRYLTEEQKKNIYAKLQKQKEVGFSEVAKIIQLKNDNTEFLSGLNIKAKLKGSDTYISIKKILGDNFDPMFEKDKEIIIKIWDAIYNNTGNEYDEKSPKVSALINILKNLTDESIAKELALKLAQNISYPRKYSTLSAKAINNILPLMQINPVNPDSDISEKLKRLMHVIETGDVTDNENIDPYMMNYIQNNPDILNTGGMTFTFATSLVYGRQTTENIKPTITDYHDIKYNPNRNLGNSVVEQIANETMQIVKAIWRQYKFIADELEIRIELGRDLKNSASERERIYKGQINNQKNNNRIKQKLEKANTPVTDENILKYRLYEQQKSISPYSGSKLQISKFTEYEIDHIIPKSRLFDDSIANKVLVERILNKEKGNQTAWEYITQQASHNKIYSVEAYLKNVNDNYFGKKKSYLLLENIPANFIKRQIKETQYNSIAIRNELSKIVGSENVITSTEEVTNFLRTRWGLKKLFMKLTEDRFRQMELWDWNKEAARPNNYWISEYFDSKKQRNIYEIKHWSKRYDYRHHAIDALVVALTEQSDIQRLNNLNNELQEWLLEHKEELKLEVKEGENIVEAFFKIEEKRREEIQRQIEDFRKFNTPFPDLLRQTKDFVETIVVSHKHKDNLSIQVNEKTKKKELKIRGALHEQTFYGKRIGQDTKTISISNLAAADIGKVTDDVLKEEIISHKKQYDSMKEAFTGEGLRAFNEGRFQVKNPKELKPPVYRIKIFYNTKEVKESSLKRLYKNNDKFNVKTGDNYLFLIMEKDEGNEKQRFFDIVSLYDGAQIAKKEWKNGHEDFKKRMCEDYRIKHKDKPDRVLFTLQQNELVYLPENAADPVLNFTKDEFTDWISVKENKINFSKRIYKVVKFTGKDCFFIPHNYAITISTSKDLTEVQKAELRKQYGEKKIPQQELNFEEFGSFGNSAKTEVNEYFVKELVFGKKEYKGYRPIKIQNHCIKIESDWLGNIKLVK